jgi:hypothetical protein
MRTDQLFPLIVVGLLGTPIAAQVPKEPELPDDQQEAVAAILRRGGYASRDSRLPGHPVTQVSLEKGTTDHELGLLVVFPRLKEVALENCAVTDAGLERLAAIRPLEKIELTATPITVAGLRHLFALPALRVVSISHCPMTDAGVAELAKIASLEALNIHECPITDAGLAELTKLPALRDLNINQCPITDAGLARLAGCRRLRNVYFRDTEVTDAGVDRLKEALPYALISAWRHSDSGNWNSPLLGLAWRLLVVFAVGMAVVAGIHRARRRSPNRRAWPWKVMVVLTVLIALGVALRWAGRSTYPVRDGTAAQFWLHATGIDLGVRNPERGIHHYYLPRDGWFIYYDQGFHGQFLRRVPAADAQALFPKVVERLRNAPPDVLRDDVETGFREWEQSGAGPNDAAGLLVKIREAWLDRLLRSDPSLYQYVLPEEDDFTDRWNRIQRFHWNLWFEFAFFTLVILVAAWPWLRNARRWQWAVHLALLPPLFCLPFWLGYAPLTFTSAGDQEVVLYPWLVRSLGGLPRSQLDPIIYRALPKPLEPLSQTTGPMLSLSGFGPPGPVIITLIGLLLGLAVGFGPVLVRHRARIAAWVRRQVL